MQRLFQEAAIDSLVEIATLRHNGDKKWLESSYIPPSEFTAVMQQKAGAEDILFGPALRMSKSSKRDDILSARVTWVDYDAQGLAPSVLPPSFVVKSNGPNKGTHLYWLLSKYIQPGLVEDLYKVLIVPCRYAFPIRVFLRLYYALRRLKLGVLSFSLQPSLLDILLRFP